MSPYVLPDHISERNLPTHLTPTFWGALSIVSFDSLDDSAPQLESSVIHEGPVPAQLSAPSKEPENSPSTPTSKPIDIPAVPHRRLYFDDGNITFRVQSTLYCLHRSLLCRGSRKFENLLSQLSAQRASSTSLTIPLDDVKAVDFDAFLSILYPENHNTLEERSFEEWSKVLDLSTRWGFTNIRDLAIRCIKPPDPLKKLLLARKHAVEKWTLPALLEICERSEPLSLEEARLMDYEDAMLVGSVRQAVRSSALTFNRAEIRNCIQKWKSGEPWNSVPDPPDSPLQVHGMPSDKLSSTEGSIFRGGVDSRNIFGAPADDWSTGASKNLKSRSKKR